jgi:hypothetical protein
VCHWTDDNIGINHCQIEGRGFFLDEVPRSHLGSGLRYVVSQDIVLLFDGLFSCDLSGG